MKYAVSLTVGLDTGAVRGKEQYLEHSLRVFVSKAFTRVLQQANEHLPAGLKLDGVNATVVVELQEDQK